MGRQRLEALLEDALVLKAEQDLRPKDQRARLVQRRLHPLVQRHHACRRTVTRCANGTPRTLLRCRSMVRDGLVALPPTSADLWLARRTARVASPPLERAAQVVTWAADEHLLLGVVGLAWL